jgi:hypothetical protein
LYSSQERKDVEVNRKEVHQQSRKETTNANGKPNGDRKPNPMHDRIIKLLSRPNGCTRVDLNEVEFPASSMTALRIAERKGFKTSAVKKPGELTIYKAVRAKAASAKGLS